MSTDDHGLPADLVAAIDTDLAGTDAPLADDERARRLRPERGPEPLHVCYLPADLVTASTTHEWGDAATAALDAALPEALDALPEQRDGPGGQLSDVLGVPRDLLDAVLPRVRATLRTRPVADLRADLEDGYGHRPDADEDADAHRCARAAPAAHLLLSFQREGFPNAKQRQTGAIGY